MHPTTNTNFKSLELRRIASDKLLSCFSSTQNKWEKGEHLRIGLERKEKGEARCSGKKVMILSEREGMSIVNVKCESAFGRRLQEDVVVSLLFSPGKKGGCPHH
jgi:hypothetical protein